MRNSKWQIVGPALVLTLGLNSCKPTDKMEQPPPYRIAEPNWQSGNKFEKFTDSIKSSKGRKIGDVLNVSTNPAYLHANTRCMNEVGKVSLNSSLFPTPKQISLFSMLPAELLIPGALKRVVLIRCSIDFEAINGDGSSHRFRMPEIPVSDDSDISFGISWPGSTTNRVFYNEEFAKERIYVIDNKMITPILRCSDKDVHYQRGGKAEFWLSDFDWDPTKKTASKLCRVLGLDKGIVTAISPSFTAVFIVKPVLKFAPGFPFGRRAF